MFGKLNIVLLIFGEISHQRRVCRWIVGILHRSRNLGIPGAVALDLSGMQR